MSADCRSAEGLRRFKDAMRARWADPEWRATKGANFLRSRWAGRAKVSRAKGSRMRRESMPVPQWVSADLREEYRDIALLYGEEIAAREIRRMKAEAEREH